MSKSPIALQFYRYFVSYNISLAKDGKVARLTGNGFITCSAKLNRLEDIREIEKQVSEGYEKEYEAVTVNLINFILVEDEA